MVWIGSMAEDKMAKKIYEISNRCKGTLRKTLYKDIKKSYILHNNSRD